MPKLPVITARECVRALQRAGFVIQKQRGSHMTLFHEESQRTTVVAMHPGDLPPGLLRAIIRQSGLTVEEFTRLL